MIIGLFHAKWTGDPIIIAMMIIIIIIVIMINIIIAKYLEDLASKNKNNVSSFR